MFKLLNRPVVSFSKRLCSCSSPASNSVVHHDPTLKEFSIGSNDEKAVLHYKLWPSTIDLEHTIVPESLKGQGKGQILVEAALEYALSQNLKVKASCNFAHHYLAKNPKEKFRKLILDT